MLSNISEVGNKLFGIILKGVEEGRSGISILKSLREQGLGYRTQTFYADYNSIKQATQKWDSLKYYPRNKVIGEDAYRPAKAPLEANYYTKCRFTYVNPDTGERVEKYYTIAHDTRMSRNELRDYWDRWKENFIVGEGEEYSYQLVDILPVQGYRNE